MIVAIRGCAHDNHNRNRHINSKKKIETAFTLPDWSVNLRIEQQKKIQFSICLYSVQMQIVMNLRPT